MVLKPQKGYCCFQGPSLALPFRRSPLQSSEKSKAHTQTPTESMSAGVVADEEDVGVLFVDLDAEILIEEPDDDVADLQQST